MSHHILPTAESFADRLLCSSAAATADLGQAVAGRLRGGEVILLYGLLGAGKTCFAQGLCRGLGVRDQVTSPTFNLAHRYTGRLVVHHLDFYRVEPDDDLNDIGVEEVLDDVAGGDAVLVAEWPDLLVPLVPERLEWLALPGEHQEDRWWYLRGIPSLSAGWADLLDTEEPRC